MDKMTRQDMRNRIDSLLTEVAELEKQQQDKTLPHSDQQLLDQAWEDLQDQIALLQEAIEMGEEEEYDDDDEEEEEEEQEEEDYQGLQEVYYLGGNVYISAEELDRYNNMEDDRVGCDYYEEDFGGGYNPSDEI